MSAIVASTIGPASRAGAKVEYIGECSSGVLVASNCAGAFRPAEEHLSLFSESEQRRVRPHLGKSCVWVRSVDILEVPA